mmetsp:Transcript_353/g.1373  ORF Transcript_353/g.1373 Transcript_353/m.1373 type:complete len:239 (+) Transcript_353:675-1391(+)
MHGAASCPHVSLHLGCPEHAVDRDVMRWLVPRIQPHRAQVQRHRGLRRPLRGRCAALVSRRGQHCHLRDALVPRRAAHGRVRRRVHYLGDHHARLPRRRSACAAVCDVRRIRGRHHHHRTSQRADAARTLRARRALASGASRRTAAARRTVAARPPARPRGVAATCARCGHDPLPRSPGPHCLRRRFGRHAARSRRRFALRVAERRGRRGVPRVRRVRQHLGGKRCESIGVRQIIRHR